MVIYTKNYINKKSEIKKYGEERMNIDNPRKCMEKLIVRLIILGVVDLKHFTSLYSIFLSEKVILKK